MPPLCPPAVCPPYELVDYAELYDLLEASPLMHQARGCDAWGWDALRPAPARVPPRGTCSTVNCAPCMDPAVSQTTPTCLLYCSPVPQDSIVVVEYPKKLAHLVRPRLGPLAKLRDRRYGRTYIAVYGPDGGEGVGEEE